MAIEFDAAATQGANDDTTWTHTTTSGGSGRIVIVGISNRYDVAQGVNDIATVTYGGDGLTEKAYQHYSDELQLWLWYIVNPQTGANTVSVDVNPLYSGANFAFVSVSYTGIDADNPFGTIYKTSEYTNAAVSETIVSAADEQPIAVCGSINTTVHTPSAGSTERGEAGTGTGGAHTRCSINDEPGAATVDMGFSAGANTRKILISTSLRPKGIGRKRLADYFRNSNDPKRRIFSVSGGTVPVAQLNVDAWTRSDGLFLPTAKKHTSLIREPAYGYNESISYKDDRDQASIQTVTETQLESLFRRLGARGA